MNTPSVPEVFKGNLLKTFLLTSSLFFAFMGFSFSQDYSAKIWDTLIVKNPTPLIINIPSIWKAFFLDDYFQIDAVERVLPDWSLVEVKDTVIDGTNGDLDMRFKLFFLILKHDQINTLYMLQTVNLM